ncbi:MAG: hypothetical protein ACPGOV_05100 [Magnetovibrionaceae bacterium]
MTATEIALDPLLPWPFLIAAAVLVLLVALFGLWRGAKAWWLRGLAMALVVLALIDPLVVEEQREPQSDIALVVVDESASQTLNGRNKISDEAVDALMERAADLEGVELRIIRQGGDEDGSRLVNALNAARAEVPSGRYAGAFLITDGQIHDMEAELQAVRGPLHVLLTGREGEIDRRLVVDQAPGFGIVGREVGILYHVDDQQSGVANRGGPRGMARVSVSVNGEPLSEEVVPVGAEVPLEVMIDRAGPTLVELSVEAADGELSLVNNKTVVTINGVRDRLRVLLVSGQPHAGERNWRNLLKSDPSVDLVHFTILRPPEKDDFTPLRELSLIVFPTRELFEQKLDEFHLIIFDRYVIRDVLPSSHLRNIRDYVSNGGALLVAVGPEFAGNRSLYNTALGDIIPGTPTGKVMEQPFRPRVTSTGQRHPVTTELPGAPADGTDRIPDWGPWNRLLDVQLKGGKTLMDGPAREPLLVVDRVGEGRVGLLTSDQLWLWARGYEGGGPQAELMRRLAHWLMREPELEEERLSAEVEADTLTVTRRSLEGTFEPASIVYPSGREESLVLAEGAAGIASGRIEAAEQGLYRIAQGGLETIVASGRLNPLEFADLRTTADRLAPVVQAEGGSVVWLGTEPVPDIRHVQPGRDAAGRGWAGVIANEAHAVSGLDQAPLLPGWLLALLLISALAFAWWREGQ